MIDGGGAGAMGDEFEGGGLLSAFANALADPYGSKDPERMAARQAVYSSDNIGGGPMAAPAPMTNVAGQPMGAPAPTGQSPLEMFGGQQPAAYTPTEQSPLEMFGGQQPAAYTPQMTDYTASGMTPATGYTGPGAIMDLPAPPMTEFTGPGPGATMDLPSSPADMSFEELIKLYLSGYGMPRSQGQQM